MGVFTLAMFFVDIERVNALSDISNLMYISGAGIVGCLHGQRCNHARQKVMWQAH
jgi:hypothetical protein